MPVCRSSSRLLLWEMIAHCVMPALEELLIAREGDTGWGCGYTSSAQVAVCLRGRAGRGVPGGGLDSQDMKEQGACLAQLSSQCA